MRPLSLTLKNFIGVRSGLNRDEVTLDLSRYTGLVALTAPNGYGKTTILDSLSPYRIMASRADGYSPRQFSYYEETYGDARKLFEWSHGGNTYRSDLYIKGTTRNKKTEAYLYIRTPDGWQPMVLPDGSTSDGKTDTYDACVDHILGSPALFFTSAFAAQGRRMLSNYPAGDIKLLMSDLLGLDHLLALADRAAETAKAAQSRYDGMTAALAVFDQAEAELRATDATLTTTQEALGSAQSGREAARQQVAAVTGALAEARAKASNHDERVRRRQQLQAELARLREAQDAAMARHREELARIEDEARGADLQNDLLRLRAQLGSLEKQVTLHDAAISAGSNGFLPILLVQARDSLAAFDSELAAARAKAQALADAPVRQAQAQARLNAAVVAGKTQKATLEGLTQRADLVAKVPCAGMDINAACPLLKEAHGARAQIEPLTQDLEQVRTNYRTAQADIDAAGTEVAALAAAQGEVTRLEAKQRTVERSIADLERKEQAAATAEQARAHKAQVQQDLVATRQTLQEKLAALETRRTGVRQRSAEVSARMATEGNEFRGQQARLETDIAALPADSAREDLAQAEQAVETADAALAELDRRVSLLTGQLGAAQERQQQLQAKLRDAEKARLTAAGVAEDAAHWRLLAKALGRDGIVALSIDDAGPSISTICNDLLTACYGPRFALRFDTQTAKKDGSLKESFDIRVFDAERGDDKSITKVSGGEAVWLNDCLCRAITLFQAQQCGRGYECLFSDESDGALDPEHKVQFMRMKRKVMQIGGFTTEYFISHTPELTEHADHRIDVAALRIPA